MLGEGEGGREGIGGRRREEERRRRERGNWGIKYLFKLVK